MEKFKITSSIININILFLNIPSDYFQIIK